MLIVIRGNSGSGKSTVTEEVQHALGWPTAVLGQDHFRRVVHKEREGFSAFDLSFEQTVRRHAGRSQAAEFGPGQMRPWYRGWDPLPFVAARRILPDEALSDVVQPILEDR